MSQQAKPWPLPFQASEWPRKQRAAVSALWAWFHALQGVVLPDERDLAEEVEAERTRLADGKLPSWVDPKPWHAALEVVHAHGLKKVYLLDTLHVLATNGRSLVLADKAALYTHIDQVLVPHARLLAQLANADHTWQKPYVTEFARGFFVITSLIHLKDDMARGRLFIPQTEMDQAGITVADLKSGNVTEPVRKLLWKQVIRARDAFSHAQPLVQDVARPYRTMVKRAWFGGLEVLGEIERRKYDVWSRPVVLSPLQHAQVRLQARLGKAASRKK